MPTARRSRAVYETTSAARRMHAFASGPQKKRVAPPYGAVQIMKMRLPLNSSPYGLSQILNMGHVLKISTLWL
jgi:hypothetical protein